MSDVHDDDAAGSGWTRLLVVLACRAYRAVLLVLAATAVLPVVAGWGSYVVSSDSMRPSIAVGDVVLASPTSDDHQVRVGRVYVFDDPAREGRLLVHRIVERRDDGDFTTAGDANDVTDLAPLESSGIRAQAVLLAPTVGLPVHWARTGAWGRLGVWLLLSCAAFAIAATRLDEERPSRRGRRRVAVATAVAVGAVAAGTSGAAGASFTARTVSSGWTWTAGAWVQPYVGAVLADQPYGLWLLDEPAGRQYASDRSGNNRTGEYLGSVTAGVPGGLPKNPGTSVRTTGGRVVLGTQAVAAPSAYSIELWFRTTATTRSYLAGFEDDRDAGYSLLGSDADRSVTMESTGRLTFGSWPWQSTSITTPRAYNDGAWHHLVVTSTNARATTIYVDGTAVAAGTTSTVGSYTGFWRVGQGSIGWLNTPAFTGDLDNVAIYHSTLPAARVAAHWAAR
ncbi:MAG TPA: signal peptidase I [Nocardioides sp.]|nr:signal peptidase I [Nocardioides sp.]